MLTARLESLWLQHTFTKAPWFSPCASSSSNGTSSNSTSWTISRPSTSRSKGHPGYKLWSTSCCSLTANTPTNSYREQASSCRCRSHRQGLHHVKYCDIHLLHGVSGTTSTDIEISAPPIFGPRNENHQAVLVFMLCGLSDLINNILDWRMLHMSRVHTTVHTFARGLRDQPTSRQWTTRAFHLLQFPTHSMIVHSTMSSAPNCLHEPVPYAHVRSLRCQRRLL